MILSLQVQLPFHFAEILVLQRMPGVLFLLVLDAFIFFFELLEQSLVLVESEGVLMGEGPGRVVLISLSLPKFGCNFVLQEKVEYPANMAAPVQENPKEIPIEDVHVQGLLKLVGEDMVVVVKKRDHLQEQVGVIGLKYALYASVEVVEVEFGWDALVLQGNRLEVAVQQF